MSSVENTPKKIYFGGSLWDEFTSKYYNEKNDAFGILFQQYTAGAADKIYNPSNVIEWKANTEKAYYEEIQDSGVDIISEKI